MHRISPPKLARLIRLIAPLIGDGRAADCEPASAVRRMVEPDFGVRELEAPAELIRGAPALLRVRQRRQAVNGQLCDVADAAAGGGGDVRR